MTLSESDTTPGSLNTITLGFQPSVNIDAGYTVVIAGLLHSQTATTALLTISGGDASRFAADDGAGTVTGGKGNWDQASGTLTLTVAVGQTIPSDSVTTLTFELLNPASAPPTAAVVPPTIAAPNSIAPAPMATAVLGAGGGGAAGTRSLTYWLLTDRTTH